MYKIYNRKTEKYLKIKNLGEMEDFVVITFLNTNEIIYKTYSNVEYHISANKKYEGVSVKYGHDSYGNPLYMIVVFKNGKHIETIKSKQSYNINETVKHIFKRYNIEESIKHISNNL